MGLTQWKVTSDCSQLGLASLTSHASPILESYSSLWLLPCDGRFRVGHNEGIRRPLQDQTSSAPLCLSPLVHQMLPGGPQAGHDSNTTPLLVFPPLSLMCLGIFIATLSHHS